MDEPVSAKEAANLIGVDVERLRRWIRLGLVEVSSPGGLGWREHRLTPAEVEQLRVVAALLDYGSPPRPAAPRSVAHHSASF